MIIRRILSIDASPQDRFIYFVAFLIAVVFAIVIHEFAHAVVALWNGDPTAKEANRLTLNPVKHFDIIGFISMMLIGLGWAKPVPINPARFKKYKLGIFTVSIAGVLTNLIAALVSMSFLAIISASSKGVLPENQVASIIVRFFIAFFMFSTTLNIALMAFNILPIYPLDGFNVIALFTKPENRVIIFIKKYGFFILIAVMILGNLLSSINPYLDIFGLYLQSIFNGIARLFDKIVGFIS